jgi:hypothetical protein
MQNLIVHPGGPFPFLLEPAHVRLCSRAPAPADRLAPPVSSTAARHCTVAHPSDASLPSLFPLAMRAWRMSLVSTVLGPLPGAVRQLGPGPTAPPRPDPPPPHLFPPLFSSTTLPLSHSLPTCAAPLVLPSPLLSDPSSRVPEPLHRSPHPDCRIRPPGPDATRPVPHRPPGSAPSPGTASPPSGHRHRPSGLCP